MNIGLVGCGRVGTTLCYLVRTRHNIVGVHDIKTAKERKTLRVLGLKKNVHLKTMCEKSTAIFIATPDDEIVTAFTAIEPLLRRNTSVLHFSGALPSTLFPKRKGIYRAAVHPFATFPRLIIPPQRTRFLLFMEGDSRACAAARRIFQGRSFSIASISAKNKVFYHLAGVFASNFVVALMQEIGMLMKRANMSSRALREAVLPIMRDTLSNIDDWGIRGSLSGPLHRGDIRTIREHVHALRHDPLLLNTYCILSLAILETRPDSKEKKRLRRILTSMVSR